ncbi:hypothetical protein B0H17DRAFT_1213971 [Mycena rosella]|uniref:Uncharacterized protein n=1 Tax=Mycena rosella TaxID=1033263 RepID=A0AAD7CPS3_MYCRO|nr:hypothetical protein B0H17DRAFT_1213971 [Mycena rosella]
MIDASPRLAVFPQPALTLRRFASTRRELIRWPPSTILRIPTLPPPRASPIHPRTPLPSIPATSHFPVLHLHLRLFDSALIPAFVRVLIPVCRSAAPHSVPSESGLIHDHLYTSLSRPSSSSALLYHIAPSSPRPPPLPLRGNDLSPTPCRPLRTSAHLKLLSPASSPHRPLPRAITARVVFSFVTGEQEEGTRREAEE